jgi:hypothetical protein
MNVLKRQDKPCRVQGNAAGEHANYLNVGCSSQYGRDCHHRRGHFYVHQNQVWSNIYRQLDSLLEVGSSSNKIHNIVKVQYVADGFKVSWRSIRDDRAQPRAFVFGGYVPTAFAASIRLQFS